MLLDGRDQPSLARALQHSIQYLSLRPPEEAVYPGHARPTASQMRTALEAFRALVVSSATWEQKQQALQYHFTLLKSSGSGAPGRVVYSAYYDPTLPARLSPDDVFRYPIYGRPPDLIDVDLEKFDPALTGYRIAGRRQGTRLVPYPTRQDIDGDGCLAGKRLEIAWARDPMELLDLHIEGSGWLDLGDGKRVRIRFDGTNGRRYRSIGQHLIQTEKIPAAEFNRKRFHQYMAEHPDERQSLMNVNERYTFFRLDRGPTASDAYGNLEVPLTPWRSAALDPRIVPKGALLWMDAACPSPSGPLCPSGDRIRQFILNQDEGGAIRGPGRVDYYVGGGETAMRTAWNFWQEGTLYLLLPKP